MPMRPYDQNQSFLLPPDMADWVPPQAPARVFSDLIDQLDLSGFKEVKAEGRPRFATRMMVKVLLWAYATGVRASRKIEDRVHSDMVFMWLAGLEQPDFRTICLFRKCNLEALNRLFCAVLVLARGLGMVKLGLLALDGTKIRASAGINSFKTKADWVKALAATQAEVSRILAEAEERDRTDNEQYGSDRRGDEVPEELLDAQRRAVKIQELLAAVGEGVKDTLRISSTDPDARFMHTQTGSIPAFNAELAVTKDQLIVYAEVTKEPVDVNQVVPAVEGIKANTGSYPEQLVADAGYDSGKNLHELESRAIDGYIPDGAERNLGQRQDSNPGFFGKDRFQYDPTTDRYVCPGGQVLHFKTIKHTRTQYSEQEESIYKTAPGTCLACPLRAQCTKVKTRAGRTISRNKYEVERERMRQKLATEAGKETYGQRKCLVEPVNGQLKVVGRLVQLLLRGLLGAQLEVKWSAIAHNLLKLTRRILEGKVKVAWTT